MLPGFCGCVFVFLAIGCVLFNPLRGFDDTLDRVAGLAGVLPNPGLDGTFGNPGLDGVLGTGFLPPAGFGALECTDPGLVALMPGLEPP